MYDKKLKNDNGFTHLAVCGALLAIILIGLVGVRVHSEAKKVSVNPVVSSPKPVTTQIQPEQPMAAPQPVPPPAPNPSQAPVAIKGPPAKPQPPPAPVFITSIKIIGDATCQSSTLDALKLLSSKTPTHYAIATKYISIIECASQGSGIFAYENPPRYLVGDATRNAGTVWYAGTIAHDAGHSKLYLDYLSSHPGESVPDDAWTGASAERACLEAQYNALTQLGASQYQLDYVQNVINSQYYNVPYDQRWW